MGLQLCRRHSKACKAKRPEDSTTGKFEEGRRRWKKCSCQIFVSGTLGGKFKRKCTDKWEWDKAEAVAADWQNAARWPAGSTQPEATLKSEALPELAAPQQARKAVHEVPPEGLKAQQIPTSIRVDHLRGNIRMKIRASLW